MKRTFVTIVGLIVATTLMLWSCTKTSEQVNHIPKDTFAVLMIDGANAKNLSNPDMLKENEQFKESMEEVKEMSEKLADLLDEMMKDPNKSGLILDGNIYAFAYINDEDILIGGTLGIKQKVLEENLKMLEEELDFELETEEKDGITYAMPDNEFVIGWNKDLLIAIGLADGNDTDLEKELFRLFELKKSESILEDKDFVEFQKNCKDVNFWISSNVVKNMPDAEGMDMVEKMLDIDFDNNYGHLFFDMEKDEWTMTLKVRFNESIQNADWNKIYENISEFGLLDDLFGSKNDDWDDDYDWESDWDDSDWESDTTSWDSMTDEEWEEFFKEMETEIEEE
jgi:hypothetical protein